MGDDCFLRVWDLVTHASVANITLEMPARCCTFSPDGKSLAIGESCVVLGLLVSTAFPLPHSVLL